MAEPKAFPGSFSALPSTKWFQTRSNCIYWLKTSIKIACECEIAAECERQLNAKWVQLMNCDAILGAASCGIWVSFAGTRVSRKVVIKHLLAKKGNGSFLKPVSDFVSLRCFVDFGYLCSHWAIGKICRKGEQLANKSVILSATSFVASLSATFCF